MLKVYIKQTIGLLKQNPLISTISIVGTALAVMMIMVLIIVQHINDTPMAPEVNRDRLLYLKDYKQQSKDTVNWSWSMGSLNYKYYKDYLSDLKVPETVSIISSEHEGKVMIGKDGTKDLYSSSITYTDYNYWTIMDFNFVEGKPYTQADYDSGLKKVVLQESKARELFGTESAIGKNININFVPHTVVGVVKDVSPVFTFCRGNVFTPYTSLPEYEKNSCRMLILARQKSDFAAIKEEVRQAERKYEIEKPEYTINFWGPYNQRLQKENVNSGSGLDESQSSKRFLFIFLILLIVPSINLSSFSMSQIKKRTEEIGVRKAFGATGYNILKQVLIENLITSLLGGIVGLILSYFILFWLRSWLLDIPADGNIPAGAFISPFVFFAVFMVCVFLNLLSAGIPAARTLRMNIVDSLNRK